MKTRITLLFALCLVLFSCGTPEPPAAKEKDAPTLKTDSSVADTIAKVLLSVPDAVPPRPIFLVPPREDDIFPGPQPNSPPEPIEILAEITDEYPGSSGNVGTRTIPTQTDAPIPSSSEEVIYSDYADGWPHEKRYIQYESGGQVLNMNEVRSRIQPLQLDISGIVFLKVAIDEKGNYHRHVVVKSPHPSLTNEVEKVVSDLKFSPAIYQGKPAKVWVVVPFKFQP